MEFSIIDILLALVGGLLGIGWVVLFYALRQNAAGVEKTAKLVMEEKEKAAALVKVEHDRLDEKLTAFRIKVAEEYATTALLEKVMHPMLQKLDDIEKLLHTKLDRREFEQHRKTNGAHSE